MGKQTEIMKPTVDFRNFVNDPKNDIYVICNPKEPIDISDLQTTENELFRSLRRFKNLLELNSI